MSIETVAIDNAHQNLSGDPQERRYIIYTLLKTFDQSGKSHETQHQYHHFSDYTWAALRVSVVVANGGMVRVGTNDSVIDSQPIAGALPQVCTDDSGLTLHSIRRALTEAAL